MPLKLTIVTAQRTVLEQDGVTRLVVPAAEGQITILPSHAALMSSLAIGEMVVFTGSGSESIAIHGGFIQVANDEVSVLADAAERIESCRCCPCPRAGPPAGPRRHAGGRQGRPPRPALAAAFAHPSARRAPPGGRCHRGTLQPAVAGPPQSGPLQPGPSGR